MESSQISITHSNIGKNAKIQNPNLTRFKSYIVILGVIWSICSTIVAITSRKSRISYLNFFVLNFLIILCSEFIDSIALGILAIVTKIDVRLSYTNYKMGAILDGNSKKFIGNYFIVRYSSDALFRILGNYVTAYEAGIPIAYACMTVLIVFAIITTLRLFEERKVSFEAAEL